MSVPVSCVVTCYNDSNTIGSAIESVLAQSLPIEELIVADDCSSDTSRETIKRYADRYSVVRPIFRDRNIGVAANRDLAIRAASQPFVTHLDGDDLFVRCKIEREWAALNEDAHAVAYSRIARIDVDHPWRSIVADPSTSVGASHIALYRLLARTGPIPRDMLLSKKLYGAAGGFTHGVELYEDWQFKLRLSLLNATWIGTGQLGTVYAVRAGSLSQANLDRHAFWRGAVLEPIGQQLQDRLGSEVVRSAVEALVPPDSITPISGLPSRTHSSPRRRNRPSSLDRLRVLAAWREIRWAFALREARTKRPGVEKGTR